MDITKVIYEVPSLEQQSALFKNFVNIDEKFKNDLYLEYPKLKDQNLKECVRTIYQTKKYELRNRNNE